MRPSKWLVFIRPSLAGFDRPLTVFALTRHPKAKICYAWSSRKRKNDKDEERFFAVLEIPPVNSPQTAVRASIVSDAKKEPWTGSFLLSNFVKYAPAVQSLRV
jgi:hypothetical protein